MVGEFYYVLLMGVVILVILQIVLFSYHVVYNLNKTCGFEYQTITHRIVDKFPRIIK